MQITELNQDQLVSEIEKLQNQFPKTISGLSIHESVNQDGVKTILIQGLTTGAIKIQYC